MKRAVIIIPTYNHLVDCLIPCLESIIKYTYLNDDDGARVVVVANGCVDGTEEYLDDLKYAFPWLYVINVKEQLGYTKATNLGIALVREQMPDAERVVLLNNDVVLLEQNTDCWLEMLDAGFEDEKVLVTGPVSKTEDVALIEFLIFLCVMIRPDAFEKIGVLDEEFSPGFGEDVDFCARVVDAGYKWLRVPVGFDVVLNGNMYACGIPIYHHGTKTFSEEPTYSDVMERNRQLLIRKHRNT
jgi:GT2 family glycosyltransferase